MRDFLNNWMPPDYSAHGHTIDDLIVFTHWLMLVLFVFWGAYFLYVLYRFRASNNRKASYHGMQSHWSTWGEAGVAVVEIVLLVGFSIPAWYRWSNIQKRKEANPFEVRVPGGPSRCVGDGGSPGDSRDELQGCRGPVGQSADVPEPAGRRVSALARRGGD